MSRSIHRFTADDLADAVRYYKKEAGTGVARRLLNEFERVAKILEEFPGIGTPTAFGWPPGPSPPPLRKL
ncbi:MAG: type II toxin-antitoxin system RelE/ParE family toxin [Betaproteobacteria bacterium]|nr:type II toxin-antitoxin system RelE/ParE family toxin [Betaproteobacteria bacterium]